jgi:hypothetical protein
MPSINERNDNMNSLYQRESEGDKDEYNLDKLGKMESF